MVIFYLNYKIIRIYFSCPDDIDLWTAIIAERRLPGAMLGPTGACLMAEQFKRLRDGDRFFFQRGDPLIGFTPREDKP